MGDSEDYDDEDDLDGASNWSVQEENEEELPTDRIIDGNPDYLNEDGIVVPKNTNY